MIIWIFGKTRITPGRSHFKYCFGYKPWFFSPAAGNLKEKTSFLAFSGHPLSFRIITFQTCFWNSKCVEQNRISVNWSLEYCVWHVHVRRRRFFLVLYMSGYVFTLLKHRFLLCFVYKIPKIFRPPAGFCKGGTLWLLKNTPLRKYLGHLRGGILSEGGIVNWNTPDICFWFFLNIDQNTYGVWFLGPSFFLV